MEGSGGSAWWSTGFSGAAGVGDEVGASGFVAHVRFAAGVMVYSSK